MTYRTIAASVVVVAGACTGTSAIAQGWPEKPIRLVVPYGPGGSSDISGRILAQYLTEQLGRTVVVDNRPGAGGVLGTELAARAPADGYTILIADAVHASLPLVYTKAGFHPVKDFEPISLFCTTPMMLSVHPSVPVRSVGDLIALARREPGKLTHGSAGAGGIGHLTAELFKSRAGIRMLHVPYKGGGQSVAEAVAGQIASVFVAATVSAPITKSGKLRGLGVAAEQRSPHLPDVPTFEESGLTDFKVQNWYGILAPAGTPQAIVQRLQREIVNASQSQAARTRLGALLLEPVTNTPAEFRQLIEFEAGRWGKIIKEAGIRTE
jgi:tripartite-type tricarboxylate transporter receptor subunit TctC